MFLFTFLNRRSPKSHWFHSLREIRMNVGNVSDDKRFSFGGTARAVLRARRRGPRLAEAGRTRTNSRLESRCRDASVRTRARAGCLACLPSASFEVCPFSFLYYCKSWRRGENTRATATYYRYRRNFIVVFDWRYDVTKNVRTFSVSEWLDELVARVTLECDRRRACVIHCRHAVRLSLVTGFHYACSTLGIVCNILTQTLFVYVVRVIVLEGATEEKKRTKYGRCDVCANWQLTFTRVHACAAWLSTIWSFRGYTEHAVICGTRNFLEEKLQKIDQLTKWKTLLRPGPLWIPIRWWVVS